MTEITISEYGYIGCDDVDCSCDKFVGHRKLSKELFNELKEYWQSCPNTLKLFTLHNQYCLKATNYVGVIQTQNLSIEILPKIYNDNLQINESREIFIQMLKPLLNINEVQINKADLSTTKTNNIYEVFIELFIQSVDNLIKKGIKSDYVARQANQGFLKGKLKLKEHLKLNYIHKERFYVEFDEYLQDRVANRLIKSTILLLLKKTKNTTNKNALRRELFVFDEVGQSLNPKQDFTKIRIDRGMGHYNLPLRFAKVFLLHHSFSSLRGGDKVFAMLFPMEKVFEDYMQLVLQNSQSDLGIKTILPNGNRGDYFIKDTKDEKKQYINLQPDYLLELKNDQTQQPLKIVADAKWKLFANEANENNQTEATTPASSDVYQMFAYLNFYTNCNKAYLLVPKTEDFEKAIEFKYKSYDKDIDKYLYIAPINLKACTQNNHKLSKDGNPFWHLAPIYN